MGGRGGSGYCDTYEKGSTSFRYFTRHGNVPVVPGILLLLVKRQLGVGMGEGGLEGEGGRGCGSAVLEKDESCLCLPRSQLLPPNNYTCSAVNSPRNAVPTIITVIRKCQRSLLGESTKISSDSLSFLISQQRTENIKTSGLRFSWKMAQHSFLS